MSKNKLIDEVILKMKGATNLTMKNRGNYLERWFTFKGQYPWCMLLWSYGKNQ